MNKYPPQGSKIEITMLNGYKHIKIPHSNAGILRYFIGLFLIFWLGMWFIGFTSAANEILSGNGSTFLIFWLAAWSIAGIFASYMIYRVFSKPLPEQLLLKKPNLFIDTGIPPLKISFNITSQKDYWKSIFHKRMQIEINNNEIKTLKLRVTESGNRLTVDKGTQRIELATSATEIEREWLYNYLIQNYSN